MRVLAHIIKAIGDALGYILFFWAIAVFFLLFSPYLIYSSAKDYIKGCESNDYIEANNGKN